MTPEQREEAERIRKLAAKYGTDPTAIVGRMQLSSQYADLAHGAQISDTVARVDLPFKRNFLLRVDLPFHRWIDPNRPGATSAQGLGDLSVVTGWRVYNTPEYAFLIGAASTFPTADERVLGCGKYTAGPLLPRRGFSLDWTLFYSGYSSTKSLSAVIPRARPSASRERLDRLIRSGRSDGGPLCKASGRSIGNEAEKAA